MSELLNVCGVHCRPGQDTCNGYCTGKANKPKTFFAEDGVDHAVISTTTETGLLRLQVTTLTQQLRAEKAGYSLLYEVKEQLRQEVEDLQQKLESEKKRAQVLVETLQIISNEIDECCQFEKALKALAQYQKGGGDGK